MKNILTVAGSDSSGGAGIQADLKTYSAHNVYGMSVITAVTAQNTTGVTAVHNIPIDIVRAQIDAVFSDIRVDGVKIGMLSDSEIAACVAERLRFYAPNIIILDPVMVSTSGSKLLSDDAINVIKSELIPIASMVTPNIPEAETLTGMTVNDIESMKAAAEAIFDMGAKNVLVKGGHLSAAADDVLYDGKSALVFEGERIKSRNTHGTGCTISSAICANMANGMSAAEAVRSAKEYVRRGIENAPGIGHGSGPLWHNV